MSSWTASDYIRGVLAEGPCQRAALEHDIANDQRACAQVHRQLERMIARGEVRCFRQLGRDGIEIDMVALSQTHHEAAKRDGLVL
jgi:hypothetical protein